jgi:ligand-binding SRPBCC domain-containing protein
MTPAGMAFRILGDVGPLRTGASIDYRIRIGALPLRWRTTIERFRPSSLFIDSQARGPYASWWHEHRFRAEGNHTVMEDRVYYALPFGWLGRVAHALFVSRTLRAIFGFRGQAVRLRFGVVPESSVDSPRGVA